MIKTEILTQAVESKIGRELARALSESANALPSQTLESLRMARESALKVQKPELNLSKPLTYSSQAVAFTSGEVDGARRPRWALGLPMLLMAIGIYLIEMAHEDSQVSAAADVDAELLADDLPPNAYNDAGFLEFLKLN